MYVLQVIHGVKSERRGRDVRTDQTRTQLDINHDDRNHR